MITTNISYVVVIVDRSCERIISLHFSAALQFTAEKRREFRHAKTQIDCAHQLGVCNYRNFSRSIQLWHVLFVFFCWFARVRVLIHYDCTFFFSRICNTRKSVFYQRLARKNSRDARIIDRTYYSRYFWIYDENASVFLSNFLFSLSSAFSGCTLSEAYFELIDSQSSWDRALVIIRYEIQIFQLAHVRVLFISKICVEIDSWSS